jgi:hypothetical protein
VIQHAIFLERFWEVPSAASRAVHFFYDGVIGDPISITSADLVL